MFLTSICTALLCGCGALPAWEFDSEVDKAAWQPNGHVADVRLENGALCGKTVDWDPMFFSPLLEIPATPWQYVLVRLKADQPGTGQLFWSGQTEGKYGGLSENKVTSFRVAAGDGFQDIAIVPGWHREGTIRKMRLDLYSGLNFAIDRIVVMDWSAGLAPVADKTSWTADEIAQWPDIKGHSARFSPPLALNVDLLCWAAVELEATERGHAEFLWISDKSQDVQSESVEIRPGRRTYNVELAGHPCWAGKTDAVGLCLPTDGTKLWSLAISRDPMGDPDPMISYFGFENGVNRVGQPCSVLLQVTNRGAGRASLSDYRLSSVEEGLKVVQAPDLGQFRPWATGT